jgi:hypothetical protein
MKCESGMKLISCTGWLLCALLVIGSLDAIPDPPAINPHGTNVKASCHRECAGTFCEQRLNSSPSGASSQLRVRFLAFTNDLKPSRPTERIVLTGQASDPSPPEA